MDLSSHELDIPIPIPISTNSFNFHHYDSSNGPPPMAPPPPSTPKKGFKYKECLKNHAAAIGGNATDGCGEFMPCGEDGSLEALKCSACGCHRNFHRKEMEGSRNLIGGCYGYTYNPRPTRVAVSESDEMPVMIKKRVRTKFSAEQKERMMAFADKAGWKLQKQDESVVQQFCQEIGVKRRVLKVWMHNNKHGLAKKALSLPNSSSSNRMHE